MKLTKEQLLEQSKFQDRLFSGPISHRPGEPCDHPGCASQFSHPCENCGRYAAGLQNGPDMDHAKRHIERLARDDPAIYSFLMLKDQNNWTWEQALAALIIKQNELAKNQAARLHDAILNRAK